VGNAVEDAVAGEFRAGYNWMVKGENSITNGALKLEVR
jgi:ADP-ribosylglycohydrolase